MKPPAPPTASPSAARDRRPGSVRLPAAFTGLLLVATAVAGPQDNVDAVERCLDLQDVECAWQVVRQEAMAQGDPVQQAVAARVAFFDGDYPASFDQLGEAVKAGFVDEHEQLALYERTLYATTGWVEVQREGFRIRYRPGTDAVLVDGAAEALARTNRFVTPLMGRPPPGETIVELFPDGRSFIAASSLTRDDVESTGVVALSKWTRLLVSSPRALGRGYDWQTTLSHEYVHLVVAHNTGDRAPVWLQEAIAKYLDNRWENGRDDFALSAQEQSWLSEAITKKDLVPFDEMHPSLAKIKVLKPDGSIDQEASARRAAVAYAQLSTLMSYVFKIGGPDVLQQVLPRVRDGVDAREALREAAGSPSFQALLVGWEAWLLSLKLDDRVLEAAPVVLDGGSDEDVDPVMSRRKDLANFLRLGDLLHDAHRDRAALVEYDKARGKEDVSSPLLAHRRARSMVELQDLPRAEEVLRKAVRDHPDYSPAWQTLGVIAQKLGRIADAATSWRKATALNPFHLPTQQALLELYKETADPRAVAQEGLVGILREGGESVVRPPLHERVGVYELPRSPEAASEGGSAMDGQPAPDFTVKAMDGTSITLASLKGKVVLLDFWATWCGPCRASMPVLSKMQQELGPEGLVVLGVSDELSGTVQRFLDGERRKNNVLAQTIALESGDVRRAYGVSSLPTLVLIDREGVIRLFHVGAGDLGAVESLARELLSAQGG